MQYNPRPSVFSRREREIVTCIALGLLSKQIAHFLGISIRTVEKHRSSIQEKMGLNKLGGKTAAIITLWAIKNGIISVPRLPSQEDKAAA
ncbi:MAG TPA: LuxR C-terminal-related transcriptional regulator [Candidatus Paceibacterota bacterium]|jgi:DNA-binding NarL/FixJ family response regulator|nr:LuxR C-terminal-related transcriptional regulator [Candidatus Paceibacterota bacterium]